MSIMYAQQFATIVIVDGVPLSSKDGLFYWNRIHFKWSTWWCTVTITLGEKEQQNSMGHNQTTKIWIQNQQNFTIISNDGKWIVSTQLKWLGRRSMRVWWKIKELLSYVERTLILSLNSFYKWFDWRTFDTVWIDLTFVEMDCNVTEVDSMPIEELNSQIE